MLMSPLVKVNGLLDPLESERQHPQTLVKNEGAKSV